LWSCRTQLQPPHRARAMLRGQTAALVEAKRKQLSKLSMLPLLMIIPGVILGCLFLYMGHTVDPGTECEQPWNMWYTVGGWLILMEQVLAAIMIILMEQVQAQDPAFESQVEMQQALPAVGQKLGIMACDACCFCLVCIFDLCWRVYGCIMALSSGSGACGNATKCFWELFLASIVLSGVQKALSPKTAARELDCEVSVPPPAIDRDCYAVLP